MYICVHVHVHIRIHVHASVFTAFPCPCPCPRPCQSLSVSGSMSMYKYGHAQFHVEFQNWKRHFVSTLLPIAFVKRMTGLDGDRRWKRAVSRDFRILSVFFGFKPSLNRRWCFKNQFILYSKNNYFLPNVSEWWTVFIGGFKISQEQMFIESF